MATRPSPQRVAVILVADQTVWMGNGSHVVAYDTLTGEAMFVRLPDLSDTAEFPGGQAMAVSPGGGAWTTDPSGSRLLRIGAIAGGIE